MAKKAQKEPVKEKIIVIKEKESKKQKFSMLRFLKRSIGFIMYVLFFWIPYWIIYGIVWVVRFFIRKEKEIEVSKKREKMETHFEKIKVLSTDEGNYNKWISSVYKSDSKIGVILGARGSGKTAFGVKFLENFHDKHKRKCFGIGFKTEEMPNWIKVVDSVDEIGNNSFVLIDEGGILFSSRKSMSNANKLLSDLMLIARHKNISILFISQNSSNLEVNILRQADFLILKKSSLLQKNFERDIIQKMYEETKEGFSKHDSDKGLTYIYGANFKGFVSNPLPSFWSEGISKSFGK